MGIQKTISRHLHNYFTILNDPKKRIIKSFVKLMNIKLWEMKAKAFMRYRENVRDSIRREEIEMHRLSERNKKYKNIIESILKRKVKVLKRYYLNTWSNYVSVCSSKKFIATKLFKSIFDSFNKKLRSIWFKNIIKYVHSIEIRNKKLQYNLKRMIIITTKSKLKEAFKRYKLQVNKSKNRKKEDTMKKLVTLLRRCILRLIITYWRYSHYNQLKHNVQINTTKLNSKEEIINNKKLVSKIQRQAFDLLNAQYETVEDILNSQSLAQLLTTISQWINYKLKSQQCLFTLLNMITSTWTFLNVKSNLCLSLDDPILLLSSKGFVFFDCEVEPYVSAMRIRNIEKMKKGLVIPINTKGTIELYFTHNTLTEVYLVLIYRTI